MSDAASTRVILLGAEMLRHLQTGLSNCGLYPAHHPQVLTPAREFLSTVTRLARDGTDVTMALIDGELYLNGVALRDASIQHDALLARLAERDIEMLHFALGVTLTDVSALISALACDPAALEAAGGLAATLEAADIRHIAARRLLRLPDGRYELLQHHEGGDETGAAGGGGIEGEGDPLTPPSGDQRAYAGAVGNAGTLFDTVAAGGGLDTRLVETLPQHVVSQCLAEPDAFLSLLHMRTMGTDMFQRAINTAILAVLVATKLELEDEQLRFIALGAVLHDVGELQLPIELREATGKLTEEEWAVMQQHPVIGAKLVLGMPDLQPVIATIVLEHHRRFDGGGYPQVQLAEKPHLYSRVVAIADAYTALTHPRPYQVAAPELMPVARLLQLSGTVFDPTLVKLLLHTVGFYPPGTPVSLTDGRQGVVESPTPGQPFLPRVLVRTDGAYEFVDTAELDGHGEPVCAVQSVAGLPEIPAPEAEAIISGADFAEAAPPASEDV